MILPVKPITKIVQLVGLVRERVRSARDLGWSVKGTAPLIPDRNDPLTSKCGIKKRFAKAVPPVSRKTLRKFRSFVRLWIRKNLQPLPADENYDFEKWLDSAKYPAWRKNELRKAKVDFPEKHHYKCKMFAKSEFYREPKHQRKINARSDAMKAYFGPLFKPIERELYKLPYFMKHIPLEDRATAIKEFIEVQGGQYVGTDHTAFEAHMTNKLMDCIEMELYTYMLSNHPDSTDVYGQMRKALCTLQHCQSRTRDGSYREDVFTEARMSGDMCTSLGNGFTNLMVMSYICKEKGWVMPLRGVVEGDDGLFLVSGEIPTEKDFQNVGFEIKMEKATSIGSAGFCQIFFAEVGHNLVDPIYSILRSGWTYSKLLNCKQSVLNRLTRSKALSLVCECPQNPITGKLALKMLSLTNGLEHIDFSVYENAYWANRISLSNVHECIRRAKLGPSLMDRHFVSEKWGISVDEQLILEDYISRIDSISQLDHPILTLHVDERFPYWAWSNYALSIS